MAGKNKVKKRFSRKIGKVTRDDPGLTREQAVGKAAGILRGQGKKLPRRKAKTRSR